MTLSLLDQWVLVASSLVAHADGVLDGAECDRLMGFIETSTDADQYAQWLTTIGDRAQLEHALAALQPAPPTAHREILEHAWMIGLVDGERKPEEIAVLDLIADSLGVEELQLQFWKEAWEQSEGDLAAAAAQAAAVIIAADPAARAAAPTIIDRLPASLADRPRLLTLTATQTDPSVVAARLAALSARKRRFIFQTLAPLATGASEPSLARERFVHLADAAGISAPQADALLRALD